MSDVMDIKIGLIVIKRTNNSDAFHYIWCQVQGFTGFSFILCLTISSTPTSPTTSRLMIKLMIKAENVTKIPRCSFIIEEFR